MESESNNYLSRRAVSGNDGYNEEKGLIMLQMVIIEMIFCLDNLEGNVKKS